MNLDMFELAIVVAVFVPAGVVKGAIGLGLPTIAMGLLGALMTPNRAAAILIVPALPTNVWQMWDGPALKILLRRLWPMLVCTLLGTLPAAGILTKANVRLTTALLGGVLMVYALISLIGVHLTVSRRVETLLGPLIGLTTGLITAQQEFSFSPACRTCRRLTSVSRSWCKRWQSRRLCRRLR
jgi:uncharacterized protein